MSGIVRELRFTEEASADLESIPERTAERVLTRLVAYADGNMSDIKKLKGRDEFRLRVGDYRVLFVLDGKLIDVRRILHRREAYR